MGAGSSKQDEQPLAVTETATSVVKEKPTAGDRTSPMDTDSESKCPMHNKDGSYSYDWTQLFKAAAVHGPSGSKPLSQEEQDRARGSMKDSSEINDNTVTGGCPVKHSSNNKNPQYPEYNVYSEPIDKTNQMPKGVKTQMPTSTQTSELSTDRVKSSIPKGGGDSSAVTGTTTWTYPSPQQFYNALARKGKLEDGTTEDDMASVVALHNNMNEKTWAKVVEWEQQTYKDNSTPKLLKFMGRPHDLSPKARLKHWIFGHPLPYDRHDWTVLRDDGTTVRYIIDYYYDETRAQTTEESSMPNLHDRNATPSLLVDVRPALDGPGQFVARALQMPYAVWTEKSTYQTLPLRGTPEMANQVQESIQVWKAMQEQSRQDQQQQQQQNQEENDETMSAMEISEQEAKTIALNFARAMKDCTKAQKRVANCKSEEDCSKASVDLTMCMGQSLCAVQHKNLVQTLKSDDDLKVEAALETLTECVMLKTAERRVARNQHPGLFDA